MDTTTKLTIAERDIGSELCQRCAACCRIQVSIPNANPRFREFLRTVGLNVIPPSHERSKDCCSETHDIRIDLGYCKHLETKTTEEVFSCKIHEAPEYPRLCDHYNCVSWAKANDKYNLDNTPLREAQLAFNKLTKRRR